MGALGVVEGPGPSVGMALFIRAGAGVTGAGFVFRTGSGFPRSSRSSCFTLRMSRMSGGNIRVVTLTTLWRYLSSATLLQNRHCRQTDRQTD